MASTWLSTAVRPGPSNSEQRRTKTNDATPVSTTYPQPAAQLGQLVRAASGSFRGARPGRQQAIVGGVLAVLVAAGFLVFGMGGNHTVTGDLTLFGVDGGSAGSMCEGENGYDDITRGTEVRVKDEHGTLVATGQLESGTYDGLSCVFPFTVGDVPRAAYYEISAGNNDRGGVHYSSDQLKSQHWAAHLSLGD
jgi:hypothetical protein